MDKKCKQYLLKKILLRIDFDQVQDVDIDSVIQKTRNVFFESGFKLYQNVVPLAAIRRENSTSLDELNGISAVNIINETVKEYQLKKERLLIKISNKYLMIEELIENDYKGSAYYLEVIKGLIEAIFEVNPYVILQRIGLRKFNTLVFKEIHNINKYFVDMVFNQKNCLEKYTEKEDFIIDANSKISICFGKKEYKANILTDIQTGEYNEIAGNSGQAVQAVLDIDVYKDCFTSDSFIDSITQTYQVLSEEAYKIYKLSLEEAFFELLVEGTVNDTDILGGIFYV